MIVGAEKNGVKEGLPKTSFLKSYGKRVKRNIGYYLKNWKNDLKKSKANYGKFYYYDAPITCLVVGVSFPVVCVYEVINAVPQTVWKNMKAKKTQEVQM